MRTNRSSKPSCAWWMLLLLELGLCYLAAAAVSQDPVAEAENQNRYGADVSFPMQNHGFSATHSPLGEGPQQRYQQFMDTCRKHYGKLADRCDVNERERISMNVQQPSNMQNYTAAGYAKVKLPKALTTLLVNFYDDNADQRHPERWGVGSTFVNHWDADTAMLSVENSQLYGGGRILKQKIVDFAQETLQAWTGKQLVFTSLYGIRIYKEGAVLASHVDRLPLVSSAIINVAQDVDEPWPLEVIGHDGMAHNLTLAPGEMILYESHSVIHGRPFPLKGRFLANVFVHFEPVGHTQRKGADDRTSFLNSVDDLFHQTLQRGVSASVTDRSLLLPDYIEEGSDEEKMWKQLYAFQLPKEKPVGNKHDIEKEPQGNNRPKKADAHEAAALGDVKRLKELARTRPDVILAPDHNGWRPIHEASRAGRAAAVEYLIKKGADVNERTNKGKGGNSLWWAQQYFDDDHPVVQVLRQHGAIHQPPEIDVIV